MADPLDAAPGPLPGPPQGGDVEALHRRFRETGGAAELARLVEHYERLVRSLAARSGSRPEDRDDLVQVAFVGLLIALDRFDPERGTRFVTYAWATMSGHLKRHHRDCDWAVRVPRRIQEDSRTARVAAERLVNGLGRAPTTAEVADATGLSLERAGEALRARLGYRAVPLEAGADDASPAGCRLAATDEDLALVEDRLVLAELLARLAEQERQIIRLRFVEELSQDEIAARLGSTQVRISRQLARTLDKLRVWARAEISWRPGPDRGSERRSGS
ncbi:MAG TPA: sigma-70 family RNA polymerase sigma factor [Acidimicrobiales bacterium]|nr:sigma-70 family RNA polymerase sigma factor [Acidimicrobiales bacterium]